MHTLRLSTFVFIAALETTAQAANGIREGQWEYQTEIQMGGANGAPPGMSQEDSAQFAQMMKNMPKGMKLPGGMQMGAGAGGGMTISSTQCVTAENAVPKNRKEDGCKMTKMEQRGNTVNWAVHCESKHGKSDGEGTATYTGGRMTSKMHMTGVTEGHATDVTINTTGRYLGACP